MVLTFLHAAPLAMHLSLKDEDSPRSLDNPNPWKLLDLPFPIRRSSEIRIVEEDKVIIGRNVDVWQASICS